MLKEIGVRVRMARNTKRLSQAQLAAALQVSAPYISHIEQGKQAMSVITLSKICDTLEVSADWILRNATPESKRIADEELAIMMKDCLPAEREAIIKMVACMLETMPDLRKEGESIR